MAIYPSVPSIANTNSGSCSVSVSHCIVSSRVALYYIALCRIASKMSQRIPFQYIPGAS